MTPPSTDRVVVVGAGIVGSCVARELRDRGAHVTVLDRAKAGDHRGASYGNAGIVVPSTFVPLAAPGVVRKALRWMADPTSPFHVKLRPSLDLLRWGITFARSANQRHVDRVAPTLAALNRESRRMYEAWAPALTAATGETLHFTRKGVLELCHDEATLVSEARYVDHARTLGLDARMLSRSEVQEMEPDITLDVAGAAYVADDAHLDPAATMRALHADLRATGVHFRHGIEVEGVRDDGRSVHLSVRRDDAGEETITARAVVLAGGAHTAHLARQVGARLALQPGTGYALTVPMEDQRLHAATILVEGKAAATQVGDRLWIGGTMLIAGFGKGIDPRRVEGIVRTARTFFPGLTDEQFASARPWMGHRPVSGDGVPYLGIAPNGPRTVIATGHAMMGFSLGPITGRLVAELVEGDAPSMDITALDPARHGTVG